ncbi:lipopolysaccharide biosynthesis protein [Pseudocitrobacter faecalis]|uniref:lipopolysaccharide biosynthesis protein n=1 Tax=Pseudocitrobacter faecalis TaxID=1398493 RepID=UPI0039EE0C13
MNIYFINWTASYEIKMIDYLANDYPVTRVTTPASLNWLSRKFKRLKFVKKILANLFISRYFPKLTPEDVIIYNDSHVLKRLNPEIIEAINCQRILLLRNPVSADFIKEMKTRFEKIYGFEEIICQQNNISYIPQFFPIGFNGRDVGINSWNPIRHRRCYFIGKDKGRFAVVNALAEQLRNYGCNLNFQIVRDNTSQVVSQLYCDENITYEQNLVNARETDCIVDITQDGQTGWTLRVIEAIYFNKKLITNNISLLKSDIYSIDRIFIIGHDSWDRFSNFLESELQPLHEDILYQYSPDYMIEKLIDDANKKINDRKG